MTRYVPGPIAVRICMLQPKQVKKNIETLLLIAH